MPRLTFEGNFCDIAMCRETKCPYDGACTQRQVWERLKKYEETGLEPEDVRRLQQDWTSLIMTIDEMGGMPHLHELVQAEKDSRLHITPKSAWHIGDHGLHEVPYKPWMANWIGNKFWLTREEAEAALAQKGGKDHA